VRAFNYAVAANIVAQHHTPLNGHVQFVIVCYVCPVNRVVGCLSTSILLVAMHSPLPTPALTDRPADWANQPHVDSVRLQSTRRPAWHKTVYSRSYSKRSLSPSRRSRVDVPASAVWKCQVFTLAPPAFNLAPPLRHTLAPPVFTLAPPLRHHCLPLRN
jgi:hypothetical protein